MKKWRLINSILHYLVKSIDFWNDADSNLKSFDLQEEVDSYAAPSDASKTAWKGPFLNSPNSPHHFRDLRKNQLVMMDP